MVNLILSPNTLSTTNINSNQVMTWVLGWPISIDFSIQYCKERGLVRHCENPDESLYLDAAAQDIKRRSGLSKYHIPLLGCWVEDDLQLVYGLYVDRHSRSSRKAEKRLKRSRLPPRKYAVRLFDLLGAENGPWWYRYDDGSWNPVDGECRPCGGSDDSDTGSEPEWYPDYESEEDEEWDIERGRGGLDDAPSEPRLEQSDAMASGDERVESAVAQPAQQELCKKMEDCGV